MKISKKQLFKRQITLPEIGAKGQQKLQNAKVLVVGCGGLGSPIAVQLAASGIGRIHIVDFDRVSISNLHRQVFYNLEDVGKPKASVLSKFIQQRAPFTKVSFGNYFITKKNVLQLISDYHIIVDGTDSLSTKYLLNDACVLKDKPLIYGSLYKFDGYVATFNVLQKNGLKSANLRDAFPKMATDIPNCEEAGTLNAIVNLIAATQVNEVLKLVTGVGKLLTNKLLIYNSLQNSQLKVNLTSKVFKSEIQQIFNTETYFDANNEIRNSDWLISAEELKQQIHNVKIMSVISNKSSTLPFKIDKNILLSEIENSNFQPQKNKIYVLVCLQGNSSYIAVKKLRSIFPKVRFLSLIGGTSKF